MKLSQKQFSPGRKLTHIGKAIPLSVEGADDEFPDGSAGEWVLGAQSAAAEPVPSSEAPGIDHRL